MENKTVQLMLMIDYRVIGPHVRTAALFPPPCGYNTHLGAESEISSGGRAQPFIVILSEFSADRHAVERI